LPITIDAKCKEQLINSEGITLKTIVHNGKKLPNNEASESPTTA
jgi:hypothetical protein